MRWIVRSRFVRHAIDRACLQVKIMRFIRTGIFSVAAVEKSGMIEQLYRK